MIIRVGLPATTGSLPAAAERLEAPALVSANSLWDGKRGYFRKPGQAIMDLDVALDSAGFVAMHLYGGYRWTVQEYVDLAASYSWSWWAAMDCCCEPEVAGNREEVKRRLMWTVMLLWRCQQLTTHRQSQGCHWLQPPMPVIQGWHPDDYEECARMFEGLFHGEWPDMIGVGSVCRRQLVGDDGLLAVLDRLHQVVPEHVQFHLFGVKGQAFKKLSGWYRIASMDSAAWDFRARMSAREEKVPYNMHWREGHMRDWYKKQKALVGYED